MSGGAFTFSLLSLPFIALSVGFFVFVLHAVLIRGNPTIRAAALAVAIVALNWGVGAAFLGSCNDPEVAAQLSRYYLGVIALVGPALLFLMLAVSARLERHRRLVVVAGVVALAASVVCWTTELVVAGVWVTPSGMYYALAGPLNPLVSGNILVWTIVGVVLSRRAGANNARVRMKRRHLAVVLIATALGTTDTLLGRKIGFYPFSVVTGTVAMIAMIIGVHRGDLLQSRGFDRASAYELGIVVALWGALLGVLWGLYQAQVTGPATAAAAVVPLFAVAQVSALAVRRWVASRRPHVDSAADRALEEYVDLAEGATDEVAIAQALADLVNRHGGLHGARMHVADAQGRLQALDGVGTVAVDERVRAWLIANREILVLADLATRSLGGIREPVQNFMALLDADVVVPLVDRDKLVGAITGGEPESGRVLRDHERELLRQAAQTTARALTYLALFRDAEARMEMSREVEVAAAVQHARTPGERIERLGGCEVISHYQPASQFGGDWWSCFELPDGRLLVAIGDVTGHGVPAALISATVEGACETAQRMLGANLEVLSFLELLDRTVRDVAGDAYWMSCFAAVIDADAGQVSFANAGHPFPYLLRRGSGERAELTALVSRGTLLGSATPRLSATSTRLQPGDVLVFYSDSLVESRSPEKEPFGERRFQRLLRQRVLPAGARACEVILGDANAHYRDEPIDDDITLVVVRLPERARRS